MDTTVQHELDRYTRAAEALLETAVARRSDARSAAIFVSGSKPCYDILDELADSAFDWNVDIIHVSYDSAEIANGPTVLTLITSRDGLSVVTLDCHLWSAAGDGRMFIVPRRSRLGYYFGFEDGHLTQWLGPVATLLEDGFPRARARLLEMVAEMPVKQGALNARNNPTPV